MDFPNRHSPLDWFPGSITTSLISISLHGSILLFILLFYRLISLPHPSRTVLAPFQQLKVAGSHCVLPGQGWLRTRSRQQRLLQPSGRSTRWEEQQSPESDFIHIRTSENLGRGSVHWIRQFITLIPKPGQKCGGNRPCPRDLVQQQRILHARNALEFIHLMVRTGKQHTSRELLL